MSFKSLASAAALVLCASPASAVTYNVDLTLNDRVEDPYGAPIFADPGAGTFPYVRLTGTITTDGTLGGLVRENIVTILLETTFQGSRRVITEAVNVSLPGFDSVSDLTVPNGRFAPATELQITGPFSLGSSGAQLLAPATAYSRLTGGTDGFVLSFRNTSSDLSDTRTLGFTATEAATGRSFASEAAPPGPAPIPLPASFGLSVRE